MGFHEVKTNKRLNAGQDELAGVSKNYNLRVMENYHNLWYQKFPRNSNEVKSPQSPRSKTSLRSVGDGEDAKISTSSHYLVTDFFLYLFVHTTASFSISLPVVTLVKWFSLPGETLIS